MAFGGPYPGFTAPSLPGESDKKALVETHLKVTQYNIWKALVDLETRLEVIIAKLTETQNSKSAMTKGNSKCNIATINTELAMMMVVREVEMPTIIVQVFKEQVEAAQEFSPTLINSHRSARIKI